MSFTESFATFCITQMDLRLGTWCTPEVARAAVRLVWLKNPNNGKVITEAKYDDPNDIFFNHKHWRVGIIAKGGDLRVPIRNSIEVALMKERIYIDIQRDQPLLIYIKLNKYDWS